MLVVLDDCGYNCVTCVGCMYGVADGVTVISYGVNLRQAGWSGFTAMLFSVQNPSLKCTHSL